VCKTKTNRKSLTVILMTTVNLSLDHLRIDKRFLFQVYVVLKHMVLGTVLNIKRLGLLVLHCTCYEIQVNQ